MFQNLREKHHLHFQYDRTGSATYFIHLGITTELR